LNSSLPLLSFIHPLSPYSQNGLNSYHFCIYLHYLYHHSPILTLLWQNLFYPFILQFCRGKNINDNKKNMEFCYFEIDSYIGRFLVLFPCICVLQPTLVHLYQTSSLLPSPLPLKMGSATLRLLNLLLYSEHINHTQVFDFFPFPCSSHVHSSLGV
jgi:hypothetical protein